MTCLELALVHHTTHHGHLGVAMGGGGVVCRLYYLLILVKHHVLGGYTFVSLLSVHLHGHLGVVVLS